MLEVSASFNDERRSLLAARDELEASVTGIDDPVARNEADKRVPLRPIADAVDTARVEGTAAFDPSRERWLDRLLGDERDDVPSSSHMAWIRRLSPLEATYTKERSVPVCLSTLRAMGFDLEAEKGIRPDLEDRPQKAPRACVIPTDPPRLVHLITRAQGGLHDYEAFLHEAGHALHYAGCDPGIAARVPSARARPRPHRDLLVPARLGRAGAGLARRALRPRRQRRHARTRTPPRSRTRSCSAATRRSSGSSSSSGVGSGTTEARRPATRSGSPRRRASAIPPRTTSPTWTRGSTPPTT